MKALRLKQEAKSISDIEAVENTIKQRFKNYSDRSLSRAFFWGNKVRREGNGKKTVTYSLAVYNNEVNEEVYKILKENFSELFEEIVYE